MELRDYWTVVFRRWWAVVLLTTVVLASYLFFRSDSPELWQATLRLTVSFALPAGENLTAEDLYNFALASEYLADDFGEVVKSQAFAQDVSERLQQQGITVPAGAIQGYTVAQKQHRILSIVITSPNGEEIPAIANAAREVLEEEGPKYIAQLGATGGQIAVIDGPGLPGWSPILLGPSLREELDLPIRGALGLLAGLGLAFILHYFDDRLYTSSEVETLGIRVLGTLPRHPMRG